MELFDRSVELIRLKCRGRSWFITHSRANCWLKRWNFIRSMEMWATQQNEKCGNIFKQEVNRTKLLIALIDTRRTCRNLCDGVGTETVGGLVHPGHTKTVWLHNMLPLCQTRWDHILAIRRRQLVGRLIIRQIGKSIKNEQKGLIIVYSTCWVASEPRILM